MKLRNIAIIAGSFLLISLIFNFTLWRDLFTYSPQKIVLNDSILTEFLTETSYQNILHFKNPFITNRILFPFEINFSFNDPIIVNIIFLFFLRPFLSIHQSSLVIILINIFLANILMFYSLIRSKLNIKAAFISACVFGFTPLISQIIVNGHYTYTTIYLFPLLYLALHSFIFSKTLLRKNLHSFLIGAVLAFSAITNIYYLLGQILAISFFAAYRVILDWKQMKNFIIKNYRYFFITILTFIIIIAPWLIQVRNVYLSQTPTNTKSFYGAIDLSADLASFFIPNELNPFYSQLVLKFSDSSIYLSKFSKFFFDNRLSFAYPGLLIILSFAYLLIAKKTLSIKLKKRINPFFYSTLFFALLTLGPFLKIFRRWHIPLEENIPVVIPLPFLLLHYLPGFYMVRAPARFIPIFVFFATIVMAYVLDSIFRKFSKKSGIIFFLVLLFIFLLDQYYSIQNEIYKKIPYNAYLKIKSDSIKSTVLEIPLNVRDGLKYKGFVYATSPMLGSLIHGKSIIGGYLPRVDQKVYEYYESLPFIEYVLNSVDKGNYDFLKEKPKEPKITIFKGSLEEVNNELRELNIKYILLKNDEKYTKTITDLITQVEFKKIMTDFDYDLYSR